MKIDGHFNKNEEPAVSLDVGQLEIEFLVDTGFTGGLMIPEVLANDLHFKHGGALGEFQTATGERIPCPPIGWRLIGRGGGSQSRSLRRRRSENRSLEGTC